MTRADYFSTEEKGRYFSNSQWNSFLTCEAATMAEIKGEYERPDKKAYKYGRVFEDIFQRGKTEEDGIYKKDGSLYAEFADIPADVARVKADKFFTWIADGGAQVKITGTIAGEPWKGLCDWLNHGRKCIVDLKTCADFVDEWASVNGRNVKVPWYDRYFRQMAIYQELVRQATGEAYEVFLAAVTKESPVNFDVINMTIPDRLQMELRLIESQSFRIASVKAGNEKPIRCGSCEYCRITKKLEGATMAKNIYQINTMEGQI